MPIYLTRDITRCSLFSWAAALFCSLCLASCSSTPKLSQVFNFPRTNASCDQQLRGLERNTPSGLEALNLVSSLFTAKCHAEVIALGDWIHRNHREKNYSVSREMVSVLIPEDALSEYVLESYERAYLASLMALSYLRMGKIDDARVELRRSYHEGKAILYNYGDDPVNTLLLAALWENLDEPETARPFWLHLSEMTSAGEDLHMFARERLQKIDDKTLEPSPWKIAAIGKFPELDWHLNLTKTENSFYQIVPKTKFASHCRSSTGATLSTQAWVDKINQRYSQNYHPLLNFKSWIRLPVGITYGVATFATGLGVAVGGCGLAKGNSDACGASIEAGGFLMSKSVDVADYTLKPDLRHWQGVPAAIVLSKTDDWQQETCFSALARPLQISREELTSYLRHRTTAADSY